VSTEPENTASLPRASCHE